MKEEYGSGDIISKRRKAESSFLYTTLHVDLSIILPSIVKIFLMVGELCSGNKLLMPTCLPTFFILITRVFLPKTWLNIHHFNNQSFPSDLVKKVWYFAKASDTMAR